MPVIWRSRHLRMVPGPSEHQYPYVNKKTLNIMYSLKHLVSQVESSWVKYIHSAESQWQADCDKLLSITPIFHSSWLQGHLANKLLKSITHVHPVFSNTDQNIQCMVHLYLLSHLYIKQRSDHSLPTVHHAKWSLLIHKYVTRTSLPSLP